MTLDSDEAVALDLARRLHGQWDVALVMAIIEHESSFDANAFAPDRNGGSYGLMQLDYPTAQDRGFAGSPSALYEPALNIQYGVAQLDWIAAYLQRHLT